MAAKTDNTYLHEKILLRSRNLPAAEPLRVLDAFAGNGIVWDRVRKLSGRSISILHIEKNHARPGIYLQGDNRKFALDYGAFDVIDFDAYGVPFVQLERFFAAKSPGKTIFVTFIQSVVGQLPFGMLAAIGYPPTMVRKIPTLFSRHGLDKFFTYLAVRGVSEVGYYTFEHERKTYLCFKT